MSTLKQSLELLFKLRAEFLEKATSDSIEKAGQVNAIINSLAALQFQLDPKPFHGYCILSHQRVIVEQLTQTEAIVVWLPPAPGLKRITTTMDRFDFDSQIELIEGDDE